MGSTSHRHIDFSWKHYQQLNETKSKIQLKYENKFTLLVIPRTPPTIVDGQEETQKKKSRKAGCHAAGCHLNLLSWHCFPFLPWFQIRPVSVSRFLSQSNLLFPESSIAFRMPTAWFGSKMGSHAFNHTPMPPYHHHNRIGSSNHPSTHHCPWG